jgi:hypothetical protein
MTERHLAWIRSQPCCVPGCGLQPVEAHHVRTAANSGTGLKPSDWDTVPLCHIHHFALHARGRASFEAKYRVSLEAVMLFCQAASGSEMP